MTRAGRNSFAGMTNSRDRSMLAKSQGGGNGDCCIVAKVARQTRLFKVLRMAEYSRRCREPLGYWPDRLGAPRTTSAETEWTAVRCRGGMPSYGGYAVWTRRRNHIRHALRAPVVWGRNLQRYELQKRRDAPGALESSQKNSQSSWNRVVGNIDYVVYCALNRGRVQKRYGGDG